MKKILWSTCMILAGLSAEAKKVKFAVDMAGVEINPLGVHVAGDFQVAAGEANEDWVSDATELQQEGTSSIYSIVLTVPAFHKYEYKFLNGDQFYDTEFVPVASRIGHDFNDNRWLYIDSLTPDTTFVGAIRFAQNAPEGQYLLRLIVNIGDLEADASGIHVVGAVTGTEPNTSSIMYNFIENQYEVISYVPAGNYTYRYFNGTDITAAEPTPIDKPCVDQNGDRFITISKDTVLEPVCFAACSDCGFVSALSDALSSSAFHIYPNPAQGMVFIEVSTSSGKEFKISISDAQGKQIQQYSNDIVQTISLKAGLYWVSLQQDNGAQSIQKLIIE